ARPGRGRRGGRRGGRRAGRERHGGGQCVQRRGRVVPRRRNTTGLFRGNRTPRAPLGHPAARGDRTGRRRAARRRLGASVRPRGGGGGGGWPELTMATAQAPPARVAHPPKAGRAAQGRAARSAASRSSHAGWTPPADRRDAVDVLQEQAAARVAELVPIRYGRMLVSPFTFYRGAAAVMAADLAHTPSSGLRVQLCGGAHLSTFGGFAPPARGR